MLSESEDEPDERLGVSSLTNAWLVERCTEDPRSFAFGLAIDRSLERGGTMGADMSVGVSW